MEAVKACELLEERMSYCEETGSDEIAPGECASSDECSMPSDECPDSSEDNCCRLCIICPQAYVTILSGSPTIVVSFKLISTMFPVHQVNFVNGFYGEVWRPPNSISFS